MYVTSSRDRGLGVAPVIVAATIPAVKSLISSIFGGSSSPDARHVPTEAALASAFLQGNPIAGLVLRDLAGVASSAEHQATVEHFDRVASLVYWDLKEQQTDPTYHLASERSRLQALLPSIFGALPSVAPFGGTVTAGLGGISPLLLAGLAVGGFLLLSKRSTS